MFDKLMQLMAQRNGGNAGAPQMGAGAAMGGATAPPLSPLSGGLAGIFGQPKPPMQIPAMPPAPVEGKPQGMAGFMGMMQKPQTPPMEPAADASIGPPIAPPPAAAQMKVGMGGGSPLKMGMGNGLPMGGPQQEQ